jgi:hypothetical protein
VLGKSLAGFAVNACFLSIVSQKGLAAFLVWKMVDKIDDIHGLVYFTQVPLIFMIRETIVTSCLRIFGYVKDSEES